MKLHSGYQYAPNGTRLEPGLPNLQALSGCTNARISSEIAGAGFRLTPRQTELLQLLADGKLLMDAAVIMGIKQRSAVNYAQLIRERLEAQTPIHAVAIALREKLIT